jgi:hypothetical protein
MTVNLKFFSMAMNLAVKFPKAAKNTEVGHHCVGDKHDMVRFMLFFCLCVGYGLPFTHPSLGVG